MSYYDINQSSERGNLGVYPYKCDINPSSFYVYQPALVLNSSDLDFVIEFNSSSPLDVFLPSGSYSFSRDSLEENLLNLYESTTDNVNLVVGSESSPYYTCDRVSLKLNTANSDLETSTSTPFKTCLQSVLEAQSLKAYGSKAVFNTASILDDIIQDIKEKSVDNLIDDYTNTSSGSNDLVDYWNYSHTNWTTSQFFHQGDKLVMLYDVNLNYKTGSENYTALKQIDFSHNVFFAIRYCLNSSDYTDIGEYTDITTENNLS